MVPRPLDPGPQRDVREGLQVRPRPADERDGVGLADADQGERRLGEKLVEDGVVGTASDLTELQVPSSILVARG